MHFAAALVPSSMTELLACPAAARLGWVCIHSLWQAAAATAPATTPRFVLLPAAPLGAAQPTRPDHLDRLTAWLPLVALAWTLGAALAAIRMACGVWITRRLVARATSDSSRRLQHRVDHWRRIMRIDAAVRILASAAVETPVVVGWLKPVILWPACQ